MNEHRSTAAAAYAEDFYAWTQHQAKLLRALGRLDGRIPAELDLDHIAEEIEGLGGADLNSVKSFVRQILIHLIKAAAEPKAQALPHWRVEAATFHAEIEDRYAPSMRQLIDMQALWKRAINLADLGLQEHGNTIPANLPAECPYALEEIVGEDFRFDDALKKLTVPNRQT